MPIIGFARYLKRFALTLCQECGFEDLKLSTGDEMSWAIVRHAFLMVYNNLEQALRVSLVPLGVFVVVAFMLASVSEVSLDTLTAAQTDPAQASRILFGVLLIALFYLLTTSWISVAWHRYILLEDHPGWLPRVPIALVINYMMMMIVFMGAATLVLTIAGLFAAMLGATLGTALVLVAGVYMFLCWFRVGAVFPVIAIGGKLTVREAWQKTEPHQTVLLGVVGLMVALNIVVSIVAGVFGVLLSLALNFISMWVFMMGGVSLLTTIYGHFFENRPLL